MRVCLLLFSLLHCVGASRLRRGGGAGSNKAGGFVYDFAHHGQEWTQGTCASRERQSPIDFPIALMNAPPTGKLMYDYSALTSSFEIFNNGKTLSADFAGQGLGGITYENAWYNLMNINIHAESEHTFKGLHMPLELHLVHKKQDSDALLVVAIPFLSVQHPELLQAFVNHTQTPAMPETAEQLMGRVRALAMQASDSGKKQAPIAVPNLAPAPAAPVAAVGAAPAAPTPPPGVMGPNQYAAPLMSDVNFNVPLQFFMKMKPPMINEHSTAPVDEYIPFDVNRLLEGGTYFEYAGSLTAPPCAEIVTWFVRRDPIMASDAQVAVLHRAIYQLSADFGNFRATMPLNARPIAVRQAVKEAPPPKVPEQSIPLGPNPRTDREFRAMKWAKDALSISNEATAYVKDMDARLRAAAQAHANALAPDLMRAAVAQTTAPPAPKAASPLDMSKTSAEMAKAIAQAAKTAIADASHQIKVEAQRAAKQAAQEAAQMAAQALPPVSAVPAMLPAPPAAAPGPAAAPAAPPAALFR